MEDREVITQFSRQINLSSFHSNGSTMFVISFGQTWGWYIKYW